MNRAAANETLTEKGPEWRNLLCELILDPGGLPVMSTQPHQKVYGQELIMSPQDRSVEQPGGGDEGGGREDGEEIFTSAINMGKKAQ